MPGRRGFPHQKKVRWLCFLCGLPGLAGCLLLLWFGNFDGKTVLSVLVLVGAAWLYWASRLENLVIHPLHTASNMLAALREGDYSMHSGYFDDTDPLGQLLQEINQLTDVLRNHKLEALESTAMLEKVVDEIDAGVFGFDSEMRLTLANRAGRRMLALDRGLWKGRYAGEAGLQSLIEAPQGAVISHPHPGLERSGRFIVRRGEFRIGGRAHVLLILVDVTRNLREEELMAWKRLIRVLGHELNNSLAPIQSLAGSIGTRISRLTLSNEDRDDLLEGLEIIQSRSVSLSRFLSDYARLAKLPAPRHEAVDWTALVDRVIRLNSAFAGIVNEVDPGLSIDGDPGQLEQVLINLFKNATEAARAEGPEIRVHTEVQGPWLQFHVDDNGPGIANTDNLFIPFFSTKQGGSGIGLMLCRQIAEAHGGDIRLVSRTDGAGARATLVLPMKAACRDRS